MEELKFRMWVRSRGQSSKVKNSQLMKIKSSGTLNQTRLFLLFLTHILFGLLILAVCNNIESQIKFNPYSHPAQYAVTAVLQVPAWPEKRVNLCAVLTASLVPRERSAIRLVGVHASIFYFTLRNYILYIYYIRL